MWIALALLFGTALLLTNFWWWRRNLNREAEDHRLRAETRAREEHLRNQLERERTRREAVLNCMTEGLLVLGGNGRVRWFNRSLQGLFRLSDDMHGRTLIEALRRHELEELVDRARVEGQALGLELEVPGTPSRTLQVNATTFADATNEPPGRILVFHDMTRLKELEGARRDFVANVSHELRTPLALIKGFVETLIDGASADPEVSLRFLRTIEKHANRLTFLIEDLLTIAQLESGQIAMNRRRDHLRPLVTRVLEDLTSRATARSITLLNEVPADLQLRADVDRLQQVFFNLVDNSIKYGRTNGRVVVGARALDGDKVEFWVTDDGAGIPREALERVFERFFRVDTARSRDQGGTGLGLSIVKHIVQAHGGEVQAESEPGKGTTFRVVLPDQETPRS